MTDSTKQLAQEDLGFDVDDISDHIWQFIEYAEFEKIEDKKDGLRAVILFDLYLKWYDNEYKKSKVQKEKKLVNGQFLRQLSLVFENTKVYRKFPYNKNPTTIYLVRTKLVTDPEEYLKQLEATNGLFKNKKKRSKVAERAKRRKQLKKRKFEAWVEKRDQKIK